MKSRINNELKSLEEYFKFYIESSSKKDVLDFINSKLEENNISILAEEHHHVISHTFTEYPSYVGYEVNAIYYYGERVVEFTNNKFDIFPNIDYYAEKYKYGPWVSILKYVINQARQYDNELTKSHVNNSVNEIIRKLNRG